MGNKTILSGIEREKREAQAYAYSVTRIKMHKQGITDADFSLSNLVASCQYHSTIAPPSLSRLSQRNVTMTVTVLAK